VAERRRHAAPELALHTLDFLLGVRRSIAEVEALQAQGYDPWSEFDLDRLPVPEFIALWTQHESAIRAEALRRGLPVPDPATYRPVPEGLLGAVSDATRRKLAGSPTRANHNGAELIAAHGRGAFFDN
jgi:hypothetical protein